MRVVSGAMTAAWKAEDKTGPRRPIVRATLQKVYNRHFQYDTYYAPGGDLDHQNHRKGSLRSVVMGEPSGVRELRNIRRFSWQRSVDQDVAEATMVLKNTELIPMGVAGDSDEFDLPGYMTPNRGNNTVSANRWGYDNQTGWNKMLVPDRMVKTYEGYGCDPAVDPGLDNHLVQSGVWLIEDVTYTSDGDIQLKMFDLAILLTRQIAIPPVIAWEDYPLFWSKIRSANVSARDCRGGSWVPQTTKKGSATSSNSAYVGQGLTNAPYPSYVTSTGVDGHAPNHVLDSRDNTYWVSTGQDAWDDKVWWQENLKDSTTALAGIRIQPYGGPYQVYVSLHNGTKWVGNKKIPYSAAGSVGNVDVGAGIPFVLSAQLDKGRLEDIVLPRKYGAISKVRLTFTRLTDTGVGEHRFRAGLRQVQLYTAPSVGALSFGKGTVLRTVGNYSDFTDIIKWVCGWGGFYWPPHSTGLDFIQPNSDPNPANRVYLTQASPDPKLAAGRIWGDFMDTGTAGEADLTSDLFDKKPLMDQIGYIRDLTGFVFFIDETGGVVWRLPNLYSLGNYVSPSQLNVRGRSRTTEIIEIDEAETLLSSSTTLSSKNMRDRVFVADVNGKVGTVVRGFVGDVGAIGFRRVAGWTDQHFATKRECVVMADMIVARQMFDYHKTTVRIPGNPAIQIDDQVRIFERVTNETFYQYVTGISSSIDMDAGTWTYDMDCHWLGERPSDAWAVRVQQLDGATQNYLNGLVGS